jgi:molecular chaperone DnaK (HSP70)
LILSGGSSSHELTNVIGIDLGTTYSCVAYCHSGRVEVIPNEAGLRIAPSVVSFDGSECLVGGAAKQRRDTNPRNTVVAIKRLMGLRFSDPRLKSETEHVPYTAVELDDHPYVQVDFEGTVQRLSPE